MKPRKRDFKRDEKLKIAYIKNHHEFGSDFIGIVPKSASTKADLHLLVNVFFIREIFNGKTLIKELEERGYDIETLYFEIEKKKEQP